MTYGIFKHTPITHTYLYVHMLPHKYMCTRSHTHVHAWTHMCAYNCRHILAHFLFAWPSQPPWSPHPPLSWLIPSNGLITRETLRFDLGNRERLKLLEVQPPKLYFSFIFLNVLWAWYCQVSPYNDNIARSSFLQRNREMNEPYSVLLEPIVSAF